MIVILMAFVSGLFFAWAIEALGRDRACQSLVLAAIASLLLAGGIEISP